jgi:hypothetical protein
LTLTDGKTETTTHPRIRFKIAGRFQGAISWIVESLSENYQAFARKYYNSCPEKIDATGNHFERLECRRCSRRASGGRSNSGCSIILFSNAALSGPSPKRLKFTTTTNEGNKWGCDANYPYVINGGNLLTIQQFLSLRHDEKIGRSFVIYAKVYDLVSKLVVNAEKFSLKCQLADIYSAEKLVVNMSPQLLAKNAGNSAADIMELARDCRADMQNVSVAEMVIC